MRDSPLVSVVMSVHNGERYIASSLESVLSQAAVDFEVVVVDDGSTDQSSEILSEYARKDHRVRVIRQENSGLTRALMRGCREARGVYIARQDDDDLSSPSRFEKQVAALEEHPDVAVASCWVESIGPRDEPLALTTFPMGLTAGTEGVLLGRRNPVHGSTMFRRADYEAVGAYRPAFYFAQDSDLWLRLADRGGFVFLPEVLYRFRIVDGSISDRHRTAQVKLYELARVCREARQAGVPEKSILEKAALVRPDSGPTEEKSAGTASYFIGRMLAKKGDPRAVRYMRSYVRQAPFDPRGWIGLFRASLIRNRPDLGETASLGRVKRLSSDSGPER